MAKSRRNRANGGQRKDPIVKPVKPPSDPELAALRESKILPVIKELQGSDPKARSAAASAISNIIQDTKCRKLLLREQVVHTVMTQTLTDSAVESRAAGWGILQVLAQEEDADFCIHLYRLDILTAIEHAAKGVSEKLLAKDTPFLKLPKAEQGFFSSIASSIVSLVSALAEAQDDILLAISSKPTIIHLLFTLIAAKEESVGETTALRTDAMACFMILCEDNAKLAEDAVSSQGEGIETLMTLKDQISSEGVLSCAILHNLFASLAGSKLTKDKEAIPDDSVVIPTLSKVVAAINLEEAAANGGGWSSPFEYQQLALETLASIGTTLNQTLGAEQPATQAKDKPEAKDDEDMGDVAEEAGSDDDDDDAAEPEDDEDDEMDEDEMEADMDMVTGVDDDAEDMNDVPVLKSLLNIALPEIVRVVASQPSNGDAIQLQGHALSALNNIAWSISLIDFSEDQNTGIERAWSPLGRSVWERVVSPILASDTADIELATHVTGLAWALARSLRARTPLKPGEHRRFITLYQATKNSDAAIPSADDPFQGLGVKCVGVLGQLALDPAPVDLNRDVGTFLITLLAGLPNTPAADAVEALNQIFDIYGDEEAACDKEVFWKDGYLKHLDDIMPKARAMLKSIDKRSQAELRARADEAILNLSRFIAYKRKHKP